MMPANRSLLFHHQAPSSFRVSAPLDFISWSLNSSDGSSKLVLLEEEDAQH
jgi:hypothetical protein